MGIGKVKTIGLTSTILALIVSSVSSAQADCWVKSGSRVFTKPNGIAILRVPDDTYVRAIDQAPYWRYIATALTAVITMDG
jgi:hypothetical protein